MSLLVSEIREDEIEALQVMDGLQRRLITGGQDFTTGGITSVVNTGEPGEDARTYFVQQLIVACGDESKRIRTCTCTGFKYHKTPAMGAFDGTDDAKLNRALQQVGECKHIEKVRKSSRSEESRPETQGGLDDFDFDEMGVPDL